MQALFLCIRIIGYVTTFSADENLIWHVSQQWNVCWTSARLDTAGVRGLNRD